MKMYLKIDRSILVSSGQQWTGAFFRRCIRIFCEMGKPRVIPPSYSPEVTQANFYSFPKLKMETKETRFRCFIEPIDCDMRTTGDTVSRAFDSMYERWNVVPKQAGTVLSNGINTCLYSVWFLWLQFRNLIVTLCKFYVTWRKHRGLSPRANYTNRETAACRRS
jgi:hypothetical protein